MNIENHTSNDAALTEVTSSAFDKIEIHKTIKKDGMASMQQQKQLKIPAQGEVNMQTGGYHLMLFNPSRSAKAGDTISFTLKFANGSKSIVSVTVKKATGNDEHHHDHEHMDMGEHDHHHDQ